MVFSLFFPAPAVSLRLHSLQTGWDGQAQVKECLEPSEAQRTTWQPGWGKGHLSQPTEMKRLPCLLAACASVDQRGRQRACTSCCGAMNQPPAGSEGVGSRDRLHPQLAILTACRALLLSIVASPVLLRGSH
ncbi:hypothetical protein NDU88_011746 [Pleurodeles waltl]|uniref:Uncharacterized protein n=1 Tax=Pleurodeles waltl TaxID=8319 RepID=A0AAV7S2Q2_PLEWA|nr:hypothetical protein NDU88_011746 [Pleurodeles waltl]